MAMFKICPECGEKYPMNETRCFACGFDEDCLCCYLRNSAPRDEREALADSLTW